MTTPRVSVLIPTYRYARYLAEAVNSILSQDFADFELLISDDCSGDGSREIMEAYAARDSRIRIHIHPANIGMVENWCWCLSQARGDFVKYVFGDDRLARTDALEKIAVCAEVAATSKSARRRSGTGFPADLEVGATISTRSPAMTALTPRRGRGIVCAASRDGCPERTHERIRDPCASARCNSERGTLCGEGLAALAGAAATGRGGRRGAGKARPPAAAVSACVERTLPPQRQRQGARLGRRLPGPREAAGADRVRAAEAVSQRCPASHPPRPAAHTWTVLRSRNSTVCPAASASPLGWESHVRRRSASTIVGGTGWDDLAGFRSVLGDQMRASSSPRNPRLTGPEMQLADRCSGEALRN